MRLDNRRRPDQDPAERPYCPMFSRSYFPATLPVIALLPFLQTVIAQTHRPDTGRLREGISKSLPYLEKTGVRWMGRKKCVSCHHTALLVWSFSSARDHQFHVNPDRTAMWFDWCLTKQLALREDEDPVGSRNLEGLSQLVLGSRESLGTKDDTKTFGQFKEMLLAGQQEDGLWKPMGQLPTQKRPKEETAAVSSMWALLALDAMDESGDAVATAKRKALPALSAIDDGLSTEWAVLRLLVSQRFGDASQTDHLTTDVLNRQNSDGGWGWITGDPSDALASGLTLWGCIQSGMPRYHEAIGRAQTFLLESQQPNGSWQVNSTKASHKTEPIPTSVFLGSAWATIGLLESLPSTDLAVQR